MTAKQLKVDHPARTRRLSTLVDADIEESGIQSTNTRSCQGKFHPGERAGRGTARDDIGSLQQGFEHQTWQPKDQRRSEPNKTSPDLNRFLSHDFSQLQSTALDTLCTQTAKINTPSASPIHKNNKASRLQSTKRWDSLNKSYCWQSAAPTQRAHACTCRASAGHVSKMRESTDRERPCEMYRHCTRGESKVLVASMRRRPNHLRRMSPVSHRLFIARFSKLISGALACFFWAGRQKVLPVAPQCDAEPLGLIFEEHNKQITLPWRFNKQ